MQMLDQERGMSDSSVKIWEHRNVENTTTVEITQTTKGHELLQ